MDTPKGTIARGSLICQRGDGMKASDSMTVIDQNNVRRCQETEILAYQLKGTM